MNYDTVKLLKKCNTVCKQDCDCMEHILMFVKIKPLKDSIETNVVKHIAYNEILCHMLKEHGKSVKEITPLPMVIFRIKTDIKLGFCPSPRRVAAVMVGRCENDIKALCNSLKSCPKADSQSVELAKKIIKTKQDFLKNMIEYYHA